MLGHPTLTNKQRRTGYDLQEVKIRKLACDDEREGKNSATRVVPAGTRYFKHTQSASYTLRILGVQGSDGQRRNVAVNGVSRRRLGEAFAYGVIFLHTIMRAAAANT